MTGSPYFLTGTATGTSTSFDGSNNPTIPDPARAVELVLHDDKTLAQAARILGCGVPTVQKFVRQHLDRHPHVAPAEEVASPFVAVEIADVDGTPSTLPTDPATVRYFSNLVLVGFRRCGGMTLINRALYRPGWLANPRYDAPRLARVVNILNGIL